MHPVDVYKRQVLTADPSYTVTIPASVSMGNEGTTVDVTAENVENIPEGRKISVTIAGTSAYRNQMVLEGDTSPNTSIRYQDVYKRQITDNRSECKV